MCIKSQWNKCLQFFFYFGCYLSVWNCYLGSILAFNIEIKNSYNLWKKPLNQLSVVYEQFIYVLYLHLVGYISIVMNKFWLIDWLSSALKFGSSSLVSQVHVIAGKNIKKKYLMCHSPIKMLKQHVIPNSSLHNLKIYCGKRLQKN